MINSSKRQNWHKSELNLALKKNHSTVPPLQNTSIPYNHLMVNPENVINTVRTRSLSFTSSSTRSPRWKRSWNGRCISGLPPSLCQVNLKRTRRPFLKWQTDRICGNLHFISQDRKVWHEETLLRINSKLLVVGRRQLQQNWVLNFYQVFIFINSLGLQFLQLN